MVFQFAPRLSDSHYVQAFSHFRRRTDQREQMTSWIASAGVLPEDRPELSVLSIGSGSGNFDLGVMPILEEGYERISYTGVEPNKLMSLEFESRVEQAAFRKTKLEIVDAPFESYAPRQRFDLIHMTHSLYYMTNKIAAVRKALALIKPGGRLVIFNGTAQGIQEVRRRFLWEARGDEDDTFTAEELRTLLGILNLPCSYEVIPSWLDLSECFLGPALEGRLLLDFILECDTSQLSQDLCRSILQGLSKMVRKREGRYLLWHPVGVFSLQAPSNRSVRRVEALTAAAVC